MADTKERILQASLALFARCGYEGVSMRDIAKELAITPAALYKHYAGKQDIFASIVRRMAAQDTARSQGFCVPAGTLAQMTQAYQNTPLEQLIAFTRAQFFYWTQDAFAVNYRRMLTLEQYRHPENARLYRQAILSGPLQYVEDLFREMRTLGEDAHRRAGELALAFYAPVYTLICLCDGAENGWEPVSLLDAHLESFSARYLSRPAAPNQYDLKG